MKIPRCCGTEMRIVMELGRFVEVKCSKCGDIIYLKGMDKSVPQMIDD